MRTRGAWLLLVVLVVCVGWVNGQYETNLVHWDMQSTSHVKEGGNVISLPSYDPKGWYAVQGPATVMAGLLQNGLYPNVFYDENLKSVPTEQFNAPWWYRSEFVIPRGVHTSDSVVRLTLKGINYKANVYFNGNKIGDKDEIIGTFRYFDFDVTSLTQLDKPNVLALEIYKPINTWTVNDTTDLAITFVDWNPFPPDTNMGIWRSVQFQVLPGPISLRYPQISTVFTYTGPRNDSSWGKPTVAHLTILAELENYSDKTVSGVVQVQVPGTNIVVRQNVVVPAHVKQQIVFTNTSHPLLNVDQPRIWWPWQMGGQEFYHAVFSFESSNGGKSYPLHHTRFGIRQATSELIINKSSLKRQAKTPNLYRLYRVNGQRILIRGGGWSPDIFLRESYSTQYSDAGRLAAEMAYTKALGLNTIRLEGKFPEEQFWSAADEAGILLMPGWCCCDSWQHWSYWKDEQYFISAESLRSQLKRLRIHPSVLVFLYSSDELPPPRVEANYLNVIRQESWMLQSQVLSCASDRNSTLTGTSGVKMSGPYSWVPPNYWLEDSLETFHDYGGAWGFLTEGGPGAAPMPLSSWDQVTIPHSKLWPINDVYNYHCGNQMGFFGTLTDFLEPLDGRYGASNSAKEWTFKSQIAAYEAHRAMFEGYNLNKYNESTGVIQWMLNNAWPDQIWHLYDYYLQQGGSFFGSQKANGIGIEPSSSLHAMYNYADKSVWVYNSMYTEVRGDFEVSTQVWAVNGRSVSNTQSKFSFVGADGVLGPLSKPVIPNDGQVYFLRLVMYLNGEVYRENVYWLNYRMDVINWQNSTWYNTPVIKPYANLRGLEQLKGGNKLSVENRTTEDKDGNVKIELEIRNEGSGIEFGVRARLVRRGEQPEILKPNDVLPLIWSDNFVTIFPRDVARIQAMYHKSNAGKGTPELILESWNNQVNQY